MIQIDPQAAAYLQRLVRAQDEDDTVLLLSVSDPGTPRAASQLAFGRASERPDSDFVQGCEGFALHIEAASVSWLEEGEIDFVVEPGGGQLVVRAPNIRGAEPGPEDPIEARINYLLEAEINPQLAAHGGRVELVGVDAEGRAALRFGGGCHGCGMAGVTLRQGVEKTLMERINGLHGVVDVTDHATGANPYYAQGQSGSSAID